jgi:putative transposase
VKYRFIRAQQGAFRIARLCAALGVSRSGYYGSCRRPESARAQANRQLVARMCQLHQQTREAYGAVKMWQCLRGAGLPCGRHRVARLRRAHGITTRRVRRFQVLTASRHAYPVAPHRLAECGPPAQPDRVWLGDITWVATRAGWVHVAVLLDGYSRRVVGWAMSDHPKQELVLEALAMALGRRRPPPGLLHHTDQGRQYAAGVYQALLARHGLVPSMGRKGRCYDNAVVESFFSTLKNELVHHVVFTTRAEARTAIFDYIETFYNPRRLHQALDYRSPAEYERSRGDP